MEKEDRTKGAPLIRDQGYSFEKATEYPARKKKKGVGETSKEESKKDPS